MAPCAVASIPHAISNQNISLVTLRRPANAPAGTWNREYPMKSGPPSSPDGVEETCSDEVSSRLSRASSSTGRGR
jgi:hypothetical protein